MAKTVVITGAGSGFGKGAAVELAARGHRVIATTETVEQAETLAAEHPELTVRKLDVTDADDVRGVAGLEPDVLINNAGLGTSRRIVEMADDEWQRVIDIIRPVAQERDLVLSVECGTIEQAERSFAHLSRLL